MKLLAVHPSGLMYTKVFLRLEPLGLEIVAGAARAAGPRRPADRSPGRGPRRLLHDLVRALAPRRRRLLVQLPRQRAGGRRPRQGDEGAAARLLRLRRRPQRLLHGAGHSRARRGRDRLRAARAKARPWSPTLLEAVEHDRGAVSTVPGAVTAEGEGPPPRFVESLDDAAPGPRPPASSPEVLHRRARPLRLDRVRARLPLGLHLLQRLDLLRPQLPHRDARAGRGRGARPHRASPASSSSTTSPSSRPSTASRSARRSRGAASARSTTWRPAATCCCATRRCSSSGATLGLEYMFIGLEAIDEEGLEALPQARLARQELRGARVRALARHRGGDQHHRRPGLGPRALRGDPELVPRGPGDRQHLRQHALSRHRDLAHGGAQARRPATTACSTSSTPCCRRSCRCPSSTPSS